MHETPSDNIHALAVPDGLTSWCQKHGFDHAEAHLSEIALSITLTCGGGWVKGTDDDAVNKKLSAVLQHLVRILREAGRQAWVDVPVVVILDAVAITTGDDVRWHTLWRRLARLSLDQDWHRGDASFYLAPPIPPSRLGLWLGPKDAAAVRDELLGPGPSGWELDPPERVGLELVVDAVRLVQRSADERRSALQERIIAELAAAALVPLQELAEGALRTRAKVKGSEDPDEAPARALTTAVERITREVFDA